MIDERIKYWTQGWPAKNFGDYLFEYIYEEALIGPFVDADRYRLIGSVIDPDILQQDLAECASIGSPSIALWGCGKRDETPLPPELLSHCQFFGVRGPRTRAALGLPDNTPIGDPAFILPLLQPCRSAARSSIVCVPHFNEPSQPGLLLERSGCDEILYPAVGDLDALVQFVDRIATARFVLAGSLHAAIVACAYEVPFGFWDTGFVDLPFKWTDFAASIGVEMPFFQDVTGAGRHYRDVGAGIRRPRLSDILACCPFAVRNSVLAAAWARDTGLDDCAASVARQVSNGFASDLVFAREIQQRNTSRREQRRHQLQAGDHGVVAASARYLGSIAERLSKAAQAIEAEVHAASYIFEVSGPDLTFCAGSAGMAFLRKGWVPPNEIAPWAVERYASIELPHATRWWAHCRLDFGIIAFAPHPAPLLGQRKITVSANDVPIGDFVAINHGDGNVVATTFSIQLPDVLLRRGGDLLLLFESETLLSAAALNVGTDDRTLSFAPTYLKVVDG